MASLVTDFWLIFLYICIGIGRHGGGVVSAAVVNLSISLAEPQKRD